MNFRRTGSSRARALGATAALSFAFLSSPVAAAPGDLVPGFGTGGKVFTNFTIRHSEANALALASGGKLVVAGLGHNGLNYDMAVTRFNADGSVDASFGYLGRVSIDFGGDEEARAVAIQTDGKIVVGGRRYSGSSSFLLARLNADGTIDDTFGAGGTVVTTVSSNDSVFALAIQADGKIVAAGSSNLATFAIARYTSAGALDTDFGCAMPGTCSGKFTTSLGTGSDVGQAVLVQGDGKIVVAGESGIGGGGDFGLVRYNSNGILDNTFGCLTPGSCTGIVRTSIGPLADAAFALILQPDNKLVAAGSSRVDSSNFSDFALARYSSNGVLDPTFGLGGKVTTDFSGKADSIFSLALQGDGRIVAAGVTRSTLTNDFALVRYESNGFLDADFGCPTPGSCSGKVQTTVTNPQDQANAVAIQADGKIVAAGIREIEFPVYDMAVLRYNANGLLDASFGNAGIVLAAFGGSDEFASAIATSGTALLVGGATGNANVNGTGDFSVVKYLANGAVDISFGTGGRTVIDFAGGGDFANAILVQPADGKVILVGTGFNGIDDDFAVARLLANGQIDSGFGIGGKVFAGIGTEGDQALAAAIQPDGKIVAAGLAYDGIATDFALARFNSNGALDGTFGSGGKVITHFASGDSSITAVALQPDGKIVAAGYAGPPGAGQAMALARYLASGSLDPDFGCVTPGTCSGKVTLSAGSVFSAFNAVRLTADGYIIAAGYLWNGTTFDFSIARFQTNGLLDPTFGSGGVATVAIGPVGDQVNAMALDNLGRILVAGSAGNASFFEDMAIARLNPNGALDTTFGTGGRVIVPGGASTSLALAITFIPSSSTIVLAGYASNADYSGSFDYFLAALDGGGPLVTAAARGDFDADGKADLVFHHTDGRTAIWLMNGLTVTSSAGVLGAGTAWQVAHIADLSGDGKSDLVWQNADGRVTVYIMDGTTAAPRTLILPAGGWSVTQAGDLDGDGKADLVFQHTDGTIAAWLMDGTSMTSGATILGPGTGWSVIKVADFNGDRKKDLLFAHTDGRVAIWLMDGLTPTLQTQILNAGSGWSVSHTTDLNGDGKADVVWQHTDGRVAAWLMDGTTMSSGAEILGAGTGWSVTRTGDFDGDGKGDLFFLHTDGRAAVYLMNGLAPSTTAQILDGGGGWSAKRVADLNGDGKSDIVWENADGRVAVWLMNGTVMSSGAEILGPATGWSVSKVSQ